MTILYLVDTIKQYDPRNSDHHIPLPSEQLSPLVYVTEYSSTLTPNLPNDKQKAYCMLERETLSWSTPSSPKYNIQYSGKQYPNTTSNKIQKNMLVSRNQISLLPLGRCVRVWLYGKVNRKVNELVGR